ncbi:porin [Caballeronia ptereochthonis]|uniref:Porin n=1 Tax=Caballeronia ptereochthonis TaxID=1777144 RepID=A0A158AW05_9BURK|nr:porin [Caballeronia ptereochthonis]SAK62171.1 porin [Caballeronia ptereochthonis]
MKYRTAIRVCAALLSALSAWAQDEEEDAPPPKPVGASAVTLYGLIDQGVEFVNNVANGKNKTANGWRTGDGTATSYFGIRGSEDLGGGVKAIFDLQGGFSPTTGASRQGGRIFGRQSYVGIDGKYGRLTFGRQYTMRFFGIPFINPFGTGAQGLTTLDNGIANARADNSVSYRYFLGDFEGGVNYSFGGNPLPWMVKQLNFEWIDSLRFGQCRELSTAGRRVASYDHDAGRRGTTRQ